MGQIEHRAGDDQEGFLGVGGGGEKHVERIGGIIVRAASDGKQTLAASVNSGAQARKNRLTSARRRAWVSQRRTGTPRTGCSIRGSSLPVR